MIDSIGYTDDGEIWMKIEVQFEGKTGTLIETMTPAQALVYSRDLKEAAEMLNERNSGDVNKRIITDLGGLSPGVHSNN